jgi:PAS domain S-box-containing protein
MSRWLALHRDLGLQLLTLYLFFVGPVIAAALIFDTLAGSRLEHDVKAADLALARSIALETDAALHNALTTVEQLAAAPEVQSGDLSRLPAIFAAIATARTEVNLVYLLDAQGIMLYHFPEGPGSTVGTDFSFREYFKDALASTGPLMSIGRISPTTNQPVTTAVMPVRDGRGNFQGVVGTNLALQHLSSTLAQIASDPASGLRVSMLDASGQIIADSDTERLLVDARTEFSAEAEAALRGADGSAIGRDGSGREWLRSYVPIPAAGWAVVVQRPTDIAFASPRIFHAGLLIAIGVFLVGGLFFWMMLSRRVIDPLERLAAFSRRIGRPPEQGRFADRPPDLAGMLARPDQMGHLTRALKRMEESIERRFTELATLLETSRATSSSLDADRVIDTILEQVQRLMEVNTCALVALDEREAVLRVRASRGLSEMYAHELRIDPHDPSSPSMRAIHHGRPVQVSDTEIDPSFEPFRQRARREGYRSLLAVPLHAPHIGPAALLVYRRDPHVFSHDEIELIWNFANHAAIALENAALYSRTDEQLQEQKRVLESVMQSMSDGLILHDLSGRVLFVNRRFAEAVGATPGDLEGKSLDQVREQMLAQIVDPDAFQSALSAALDGRGPRSFEFSARQNNRRRDVRVRVFDVIDEDGNRIGQGGLFQDITRYREVDRMKSALIGTASHELRTPLASIKGYASTLLEDDVVWDAASIRRFMQAISDEADRLAQLVDDLLDMSRIEAGTLRLHPTEQRLAEVVTRALKQVKDPAAHVITSDVPADLPPLWIDARRIEVVIRNLVENAVTYSPPGSAVRIQAGQHDGQVRVTVSDDGPGVAPEHRDHIFERFYRADDSYTRASGGVGLGLAISRGFVEAHGGAIWLEASQAGAVFAFTLPIERT